MNTLSIVASFGALVWIFQDGNLSALLGFQPLGFVETTQPVILFCVLFGLSMDYEVFLLSRMKEVWDRTGDNTEAVARGLERSGRIVTSAALIVVVVAGSFAFADIVLIKALGLGMAIAVALDATVVRALLVPATMRLLGRWNWWMPGAARAAHGRRLPPAPRREVEAARPMTTRERRAARRRRSRSSLAARRRCCRRPDPRQPAAPRAAPAAPTPAARRGRRTRTPSTCRATTAPHDRLTEWWYYTGHLAGRRRAPVRLRVRDLPGRARRRSRSSWASHLAITDETGERFLYGQRLGDRAAGGPLAARRRRRPDRASTSRSSASDPTSPTRPRGRRGRWPARTGRDRLVAAAGADEAAAAGARAAFGLDLQLARDQAAGAPRRRRLDRLRAGRRLLLLLADAR